MAMAEPAVEEVVTPQPKAAKVKKQACMKKPAAAVDSMPMVADPVAGALSLDLKP